MVENWKYFVPIEQWQSGLVSAVYVRWSVGITDKDFAGAAAADRIATALAPQKS